MRYFNPEFELLLIYDLHLINFTKKCIMSPRKKTVRSSAGKSNNVILFFAIILVLAIISVIAAYYLSGEDNNHENRTDVITNPIEGTWVSNYNGTMLTIEGRTVTLESPSVDDFNKITGKIII